MSRPIIQEFVTLLQVAQVLCVQRKGWLSWLIRRVTGSPWNHVALIDRTEAGIWITVEAADLDGVKALRFERYLEDTTVTGLLIRDSSSLTPFERTKILQIAWLNVGKRYDTWQLVGIYARRRLPFLFGGTKKAFMENKLDSADRLICSELVTISYKQGASMELKPLGIAIGMVDPGHIAETTKLFDVWRWLSP